MSRGAGGSSFAVGLVVIVVLSIGVFLGFTKDVPFLNEPYEIRAAFQDGSGLNKGSPVRIAGVGVGEVTNVEHTDPGAQSVTVTMAIDDRGRPVHADAGARIRPRIFLEGNFFVDLEPGTPSAPELDEGETIPSSRTSNPVQVGEILKALKSDTRKNLQLTLRGLADAQRAGAGRAFNRTLVYQAPAYKYSAIVSEALLGQEPGDLARWIRGAGTVSAALDQNPLQLRSLITDFNTTVAALADRDDELRRAIAALPDTLEQALPALADLNRSFPDVRRFADAARPAVQTTPAAVDAIVPLLRELRGLVGEDELQGLSADLRRAIPPLTQVARDTVGVLEQGRRLSSCTSNVLVPFGNDRLPDPDFPSTGPVFEELPKPFPALAGESRSFDANGQWFKVLGGGGLETLDLGNNVFGTVADPNIGVRPAPDRTRPPLRPQAPCELQQTPDLEAQEGQRPPTIDTKPDSEAARTRSAKAKAIAIAVLQAQLRLEGDDRVIREEDITADELRGVAEELAP